MFDWIVSKMILVGIAGLIAEGFIFVAVIIYYAVKIAFIAARVAVEWIFRPSSKTCRDCDDYSLLKHWCRKHDVHMDPDEECAETQKGE